MKLSRIHSPYTICAAALIAAATAGCGGGSPADPDTGEGKDTTGNSIATPPNVESSFVFHSYEIGAAGAMVDSTEKFDTLRVVQRGLAVEGKRDVVALRGGSDTNTLYLHYASNGDFSMMRIGDSHWPMQWRTFLIATRGKMGLPTLREYDASTTYTTVRNDSMYYDGAEDVTVEGRTYACHKMRYIQTHDTEGNAIRARYTYYYWYAPATRMFVKSQYLYEVFDRSNGDIYFKTRPAYMYLIAHSLK